MAGPVSPPHTRVPSVHVVIPLTHSPSSVPQLAPPPGLPSSVSPSQSSSRELHVSAPSMVQQVCPSTQAPSRYSQGVHSYSHPFVRMPSSFQYPSWQAAMRHTAFSGVPSGL
jgi:hypothetical protein